MDGVDERTRLLASDTDTDDFFGASVEQRSSHNYNRNVVRDYHEGEDDEEGPADSRDGDAGGGATLRAGPLERLTSVANATRGDRTYLNQQPQVRSVPTKRIITVLVNFFNV